MVRSQAGLGCCLALAPSAAILIPSHPPQGRRQAASSQGQEKSSPVSQKIWRRHEVWFRRKTKGHCVELLLKNRANSGCLYCQPQTKAQGLSLTSFAVDENAQVSLEGRVSAHVPPGHRRSVPGLLQTSNPSPHAHVHLTL